MATASIIVSETPLVLYTLRRADDALILGHRLSEWCGHAPAMEEDMALANMGLDLLGQADVGGNRDGLAAEFADDLRAVLDRLGAAAEQYDICPATRHFDRGGAAHSGSASGDERDLACQEVGGEAHGGQWLHDRPDRLNAGCIRMVREYSNRC